MRSTSPRVYVTDPVAQAEGVRDGVWIDADQEPEAIREDIRTMLSTSRVQGPEGYAILDCDGFGDVRVDEHSDLEYVTVAAHLVARYPAAVVAEFLRSHGHHNTCDLPRLFERPWQGSYSDLADFADQVLISEETRERLGGLYRYLDLARYARDEERYGAFTVIEDGGQVHILWNDDR